MYLGITLICANLIYSIIIAFMFYYKGRIKITETAIYNSLIIINIVNLILEILCCFTVSNLETLGVITNVINRMFLLSIFLWQSVFTLYNYEITFGVRNKNNYKAIIHSKTIISIFISICLLLIFLPLKYYNSDGVVYSYGIAASFLYIIVVIYLIMWIAFYLLNKKNVNFKKYSPVIVLILIMGLALIIRAFNPGFLIISSSFAIVTNFMYFTIENPDVKMIEQLNVARDQAEKANNAKSDFLSSMSHEIRTPLNAIVGFSQALQEEDLPLQAKEEVKDIIMASETLLELVNGILDISKIEANKLEIVDTEYSFNDTLNELVSLTKARIGEKPLEFRYNFSPDIPKYMYGDKVRVKQIILNLLTNAVKYTKTGWIEFKVNCVNKGNTCRLIISVQDTGMGIKKESINKLFNRFERLDIEKNNTIEGTGLGLAITKKLLQLMNGQIVVQSIYGEGSKFTVAIDQKIVTNPTNSMLDRTQEININNLDLTNKRILVVDDNKINLKVATRLLQDYHCIVDTLESGLECIEKIKVGASYDLILMDDMMPKMSGTETLHNLKEMPEFNMPVIALTANAISGMKEKYLSEGFSDYLSKPIDKTELARVLNKFLG